MEDLALRGRWIGLLAAIVLLAPAACSRSEQAMRGPSDGGANAEGEAGGDPARTSDAPSERRSRPSRDPRGGDRRKDRAFDGERSGRNSTQRRASAARGGSEPRSAGIVVPHSGRYVFSQSGYEEFCDATCERAELPERQTIDIFHGERDESSVEVISHARASQGRLARTTFSFSSERVLIEELYSRFTYEGFTIEQTIRPDPSILSFVMPARPGDRWSGTWDDDVSGSYRVRVAARETVTTAAGAIETVKLVTATTFSGRYEGTADLSAWIDPETGQIVKSEGTLDVRSSFGRYFTNFSTLLRSGPGYG